MRMGSWRISAPEHVQHSALRDAHPFGALVQTIAQLVADLGERLFELVRIEQSLQFLARGREMCRASALGQVSTEESAAHPSRPEPGSSLDGVCIQVLNDGVLQLL